MTEAQQSKQETHPRAGHPAVSKLLSRQGGPPGLIRVLKEMQHLFSGHGDRSPNKSCGKLCAVLYASFLVFVVMSCSQNQYRPESLNPNELIWLYQYYVESCGPKRPGIFEKRIEVIELPSIDYLQQQRGYDRLGAFSYKDTRLISTTLIIDPNRRSDFESQIQTYATDLTDSLLWAVFPVCQLPDVVKNDAVQKVHDANLHWYDPFGSKINPPIERSMNYRFLADTAGIPRGVLTVVADLTSNSDSIVQVLLYGVVTKDGEEYQHSESEVITNGGEQSNTIVSFEIPAGIYSVRFRVQNRTLDSTFDAFVHNIIVKQDLEKTLRIDDSDFVNRYKNRKRPAR